MSLSFIKQIGFCLIMIIFSAEYLKAGNLVDGAMIKQQAQTYFKKNNLGLSLIVSDKRTFFPCSSILEFSQRTKSDWTTILVTCPNENWSHQYTLDVTEMVTCIMNIYDFSYIFSVLVAAQHCATL